MSLRIINLRAAEAKVTEESCDVCITGAGAAGLFLAVRLARLGLSTLVLEAGDRVCVAGNAAGFTASLEGDLYRGTTEGRAFGLGGTTALWGGQLVPHSEMDFRPAPDGVFDPWHHIVGVAKQHAGSVAETLGLGGEPDWSLAFRLIPEAANALRARGLETVTADWLPFGRRNFSFLLKKLPANAPGRLTVYLHAPTGAWEVQGGAGGAARVGSLSVFSAGRTLRVRAKSFVLAAGTIESARLLLEMDAAFPRSVFRKGAAVGRYLSDHLSCCIADVQPEDSARCSRLFGQRFLGGRMKSFRFVERRPPSDAPRGFAHFIFDNRNEGFLLAKKILAGLQSRRIPEIPLGEAARGAAGLAALAWNRLFLSRLYIPGAAPVHLQLDVEQTPSYGNGVRLGPGRDAAGRPEVAVQWRVGEADFRAIRLTAERLLNAWPGREAGFPGLQPAIEESVGPKPHDVYHPVGTCRMGTDADAVTDPELRVHGTENLFVLSTAVFPTGGTANPTFSMLCLGNALAEKLAKELGR